MKSNKYSHKEQESKWQERWENTKLYSPDPMLTPGEKFYNLWMFPYPSAEGLHAGHAFASTGSDVYGRFIRMHGKLVFQPIGYDSFGIHSENFALKINDTPQNMIERTTKNYAHQLKSLGHGYDWSKTITTSDVSYYKWTQWLFVELFKAGLAYRKAANVNWCPSCKTVLADEQVINGECERCGNQVEKRKLKQWFFKITEYAERLLNNLPKLDWSERVVTAQRNWIGKSEGININYKISESNAEITCWTSRPDTNYGATFIVLAPEHPLAEKVATKEHIKDVSLYIKKSKTKSKEERITAGRDKTGVFTGAYAVNSLTGDLLPVWVSDFVLPEVGTGAVVGVPGHDRRDFEFAKEFGLPIKRVVIGPDGDSSEITNIAQVQEEEGVMVNSDFLNGLAVDKALKKIMDYLEEKGYGKRETHYHLRDWLISRQRYWGPPIPMIFCETCAKKGKSWFTESQNSQKFKNSDDWSSAGWYPEENLPVTLPVIDDFRPKGEGTGPLADHPEFYEVACPQCGSNAKRETDVSDTFLDSAWYFLRYPSVDTKSSNKEPFDSVITKKWLPVDLYFGGAEHAVLHLMYARFVTQALHDLGHIEFEEPFPRFFAHGLMIKDGAKMSKSRGNVVNPDQYIHKYGADVFRLYLLFIGPMDGSPDFRDSGIEGMGRFVERVWSLLTEKKTVTLSEEDEQKLASVTHKTIKRVTEEIGSYRYNTAIAALMEFVNFLRDIKRQESRQASQAWNEAITVLTQMLAPFTPHLSEEVWCEYLKNSYSVHTSIWPSFNPEKVVEETAKVAVQVNGKLRAIVEIDINTLNDREGVFKIAKSHEKVLPWLKGKLLKKEVYVPGKVVSFVVA